MTKWTQEHAVALCREIEAVVPAFGCHVALTGGCLYEHGPRKGVDLVFYRIRQIPEIDMDGLKAALSGLGIEITSSHGFVCKAVYRGQDVDLLFPEAKAGDYAMGNSR